MSRSACISAFAVALALTSPARGADTASGTVDVQQTGTITVTKAIAYPSRSVRNARIAQTELLLTDAPVNAVDLRSALDPHMIAINDPALRDRNYVILAVDPEGGVAMNATFSKGMTQFLNDTRDALTITWTTRNATRLEGRLFSTAPLRTMDGTTYTVDLTFGVDVPPAPAGTTLAAGGGDPGRALVAFLAAAQRKNWAAIKAGSAPTALKIFDKDYNTPAENAESALDILKAWIPTSKMKVTGGQLRGGVAVLDVEGEVFPGTAGLSLVQMVKSATTWQFDQAARAGMLPSK